MAILRKIRYGVQAESGTLVRASTQPASQIARVFSRSWVMKASRRSASRARLMRQQGCVVSRSVDAGARRFPISGYDEFRFSI